MDKELHQQRNVLVAALKEMVALARGIAENGGDPEPYLIEGVRLTLRLTEVQRRIESSE